MRLALRTELIVRETEALAEAARQDLDAPVPTCPGWTMHDLARHVVDLHRFWGHVVAHRLMHPEEPGGELPPDEYLLEEMVEGARRFAAVLESTDASTPCWTWAPQQNAGFVARFHVQEAAIHRWDGEAAVGTPAPIAASIASDALALLASIWSTLAPEAPSAFRVDAVDTPLVVELRTAREQSLTGTLRGTASELLLVVWRRLPLRAVHVDGDLQAVGAALGALDLH